jgi:hypothetical protein
VELQRLQFAALQLAVLQAHLVLRNLAQVPGGQYPPCGQRVARLASASVVDVEPAIPAANNVAMKAVSNRHIFMTASPA